jgi:DNA repair protein RecN (Recombination protein N)
MLSELHIENLGVIERIEIMLGAGLTAVTGETGAGKTMLVEAIEPTRRWSDTEPTRRASTAA